jgi:hypothetical protein
MNRRMGLIFSSLFLVAVFLYFGHEINTAATETADVGVSAFWALYVDAPQKYFFNVTAYILPFIYFTREAIFIPEVNIRYKEKLFAHLMSKIIALSVIIALLISASVFFASFLYNIKIEEYSSLIPGLLKLVAFASVCQLIYYTIYIATNNFILAILSYASINMSIIASIAACQYYFLNSAEISGSDVLVTYIALGNISFPILICLMLLRKEYIK